MSKLAEAKMLGGIGSLLSLLSLIPYIGFALSIAGLVLLLLATKYISDMTQDKQVFYNALMSIIASSIGTAIVAVMGFIGILTALGPILVESTWEYALPRLLWTGFIVLVGLWITSITSAIFIRRSYDKIADYFRSDLFRTTAILRLIGAFTKIFLVGFAIEFVTVILQSIAFFSLSDQHSQLPSQSPAPAQSTA